MVGGGGGAGGGGDALHVVGRTSSCPAVSPTQRNRLLIALAEKAARRDGHMELELLEVLGRGMGGVCRKARRMEDGLLVVVKQIDISFCAPEERQAAHAEAAMQKSLRHPNIVTFLDEFEEDETLNIVMEFAPFGTLKQQLAKLAISLPQGRVAWLFANIMEGLAFLHENRVLHRDIKSDNVFICEGGIPKLGDFGVSKRLNTAQPLASSVVGTPLYVSPELCNGLAYDAKSDIWAAGCLLYELCSQGRTPFAASNHGAVIRKILTGDYAPLPQDYAEISSTLQRCLSQDPLQRPAASEVCLFVSTLSDAHETPTKQAVAQYLGSEPEDSDARSKALSWEWAVSDGTMPGSFRSLYGGTPGPAGPHGSERRPLSRTSPTVDRLHGYVPSSRLSPAGYAHRPISAPSTPGSVGSPQRTEFSPPGGAKRSGAYLEGAGVVTPYAMRDDLWDLAASPLSSSRLPSAALTTPLAARVTSVDDLSRWLNHEAFEPLVVAPSDSSSGSASHLTAGTDPPPLRPTSTPDPQRCQRQRDTDVALPVQSKHKPPSRILGCRIGRVPRPRRGSDEGEVQAGRQPWMVGGSVVAAAGVAPLRDGALRGLREKWRDAREQRGLLVRASLPDKMCPPSCARGRRLMPGSGQGGSGARDSVLSLTANLALAAASKDAPPERSHEQHAEVRPRRPAPVAPGVVDNGAGLGPALSSLKLQGFAISGASLSGGAGGVVGVVSVGGGRDDAVGGRAPLAAASGAPPAWRRQVRASLSELPRDGGQGSAVARSSGQRIIGLGGQLRTQSLELQAH